MPTSPIPAFVCGCLLAWSVLPAAAQPNDSVEGEVLVTFREGIATREAQGALDKHALQWSERYDSLSRQRSRVSGLVKKKGASTRGLIELLKADPSVASAEPNYLRHVSAATPDDPYFSLLWGLQNTGQTVNSVSSASGADIGFLPAWQLAATSAQEVVVGIIDTGLDLTHPDLAANVWVHPGEIAGNGIDDDGNGYTDDVNGYDFAANTAVITDSGTHGTHVAGILAAVGKNRTGVIGVAYPAKILPLKVSTDGDSMPTSAILSAINYVIGLKQQGINIVAINASYGGESRSTSEEAAMEALRDAGIIVCAAAGNDGSNNDSTPNYPANYTTANLISVAALDQTNGLASFSNYGAASVDLAAPGDNIYSTMPVHEVQTTGVTVEGEAYAAAEVEYSGSTGSAGLTRPLYDCGIGNAEEFPAGVSGNIALIRRGTLTFAEKVTNAMSAGAVAALLYDNTSSPLGSGSWSLGNAGDWIPVLQLTRASGEDLLARLPATATVIHASGDTSLAYQFLSGTSMATPYVTGAVAFAAWNFPDETLTERVQRILETVTPVAALSGKTVTGGRLNLLQIIDTDGDALPDWWETQTFGSLASTAEADPDQDGYSNRIEFLSGTDPLSASSHLAFSSHAREEDSGGFRLSFPSALDRTYQVEWSDTLEEDSWSVLGSSVTGTGATIQVEDPEALPSSSRRFYRLRITSE